MPDPRWNELFDRYRSQGDVDALARLFDEVGPSLLKVARHLDSRRGEAEDLVQTTFLVAIERSATYDMTRPLVPWMMGILINQSRIARRRRKEVVDGGEHETSSESTQLADVESSELTKAVTKALSELPATYREVLVAHLQEGKKPRDIARELGRPQGTVRAQLHRGLRLMRNLLPASMALGFLALLAPSSLATIRRNVLMEARRHAAGLGTSSSATKLGTQASAQGVAAQVLALLLFVGLAGVLVWSLVRAPDREGLARADPTPAAENPSARAVLDAPADTHDLVPETRVRLLPDGASPVVNDPLHGALVVRVERIESGAPVAGALVELVPWGSARWFDEVRVLRTGADGSALFTDVVPGRAGLHVDRGEQSRVDVVAGKTLELSVVIHAAVELAGTVLDELGRPLEGAEVALWYEGGGRAPAEPAFTGLDGRFRLSGADPEWVAGARKPGFAPSALARIDGPTLAEAARLDFVLDGRTRALAGRVVDAAGAPIAGARVRVELARAPDEAAPGAQHVRWRTDGRAELDSPPVETSTSPAGEFAFAALPLGALVVTIEHAGWAPWSTTLAPAQPSRAPWNLDARLERGATITGRLTLGGAPVAGEVLVDDGAVRARALASGEYALRVPAGAHHLAARVDRFSEPVRAELLLNDGDARTFDAELHPTPTIRGVVRGVGGEPLGGMLVRSWPTSASGESSGPWASRAGEPDDLVQACTAIDGTFVLPAYHGKEHVLEARRRAHWRGPVQARIDHVAAGAEHVELRTGARTAWITAQILDAERKPLAQGLVFESSDSRADSARASVEPTNGCFRLGPLFPGEHRLRLCLPGAPPIDLGAFTAREKDELDLGPITLSRTGRAELRGRGPLALLGADGIERLLTESDASVWTAEHLPPGSYAVLAHSSPTGLRLTIEPGATARADVD
ncbi:MAG: sigma-70 family RNA polymerase sigma factor [Planctomycetes bacterium]|nr:sigma-70 family RNA polymerase sigma factor [Planctomycetota bacterium]